jgi:hypothetical protein
MRPREHTMIYGMLWKSSFAARDHFFAIGGRTIALSRRHMAVFEAVWLRPRAHRNGSAGVRTKSGGKREMI